MCHENLFLRKNINFFKTCFLNAFFYYFFFLPFFDRLSEIPKTKMMRKIIILWENKKVKSFLDLSFFIIKKTSLSQKTIKRWDVFLFFFWRKNQTINLFVFVMWKTDRKHWKNARKCTQMKCSIDFRCFSSISNRFWVIFISFWFFFVIFYIIFVGFWERNAKKIKKTRKNLTDIDVKVVNPQTI